MCGRYTVAKDFGELIRLAGLIMARVKMMDGIGRSVWYMVGMRRNAKSITSSTEIVKNIHALTEANFNL